MGNETSNQEIINHLREERNHIEGILNQRFNFFIIIFGFIVASIPYLKNTNLLMIVFILGTIIEFVLALTIARAQRRLDVIVEMRREESSISKEILKRANKGCFLIPGRRSIRKLIGYYVPFFITAILIAFSIVLISSFWNDCISDWIQRLFQEVGVNN